MGRKGSDPSRDSNRCILAHDECLAFPRTRDRADHDAQKQERQADDDDQKSDRRYRAGFETDDPIIDAE